MSRKHFILLAAALKENGASLALCNEIANVCKSTNSNFDRTRFLTACGH